MERQWDLTTTPICLGMDFICLFFLLCGRFTDFLLRVIFESLRIISWTSLLFTVWSMMSQQCFVGFRYGNYARQGKTLISRFSKNCWNFHSLWAWTLLRTNKKFKLKHFPTFGTISSSGKSWYKAVLTSIVRRIRFSFAPLMNHTWNMSWSIIMGTN